MAERQGDQGPVAIVGLGLMGEVYAQRLLDTKIPVTGYDIDAARRSRLALIGGKPAESIAALAKAARCIIIAVFNTEQVEDVVENHLLPALGEGSNKIVLCMSTVDPDRVAALAGRVIPRGIRYLDVPVSGTSDQVRRGDGVALIGGDMAIADDVDGGAGRAVRPPLSRRQSRRRRARQARGQSDPRPQPARSGGRPGVRRAARARSRRLP